MLNKLINHVINKGWRAGDFMGFSWYVLENPRCVGFIFSGVEVVIKITEILK